MESVAQVHPLTFGQGVLVQGFTGELQQRPVDFWWKAATREQMRGIALLWGGGIFVPPNSVLLAHIEGGLEAFLELQKFQKIQRELMFKGLGILMML